jgi:hypothetical protein
MVMILCTVLFAVPILHAVFWIPEILRRIRIRILGSEHWRSDPAPEIETKSIYRTASEILKQSYSLSGLWWLFLII